MESDKYQKQQKFYNDVVATLPEVDSFCKHAYGKYYSEDITSEVKVVALERGYWEERGYKLSSWLIQIAVNQYKINARYSSLRKGLEEIEEQFINYQYCDYDYNQYAKLIEALPCFLRIPFSLRLQGYDNNEIAEMNNIKITSAKSKVCEARKQLKIKISRI